MKKFTNFMKIGKKITNLKKKLHWFRKKFNDLEKKVNNFNFFLKLKKVHKFEKRLVEFEKIIYLKKIQMCFQNVQHVPKNVSRVYQEH